MISALCTYKTHFEQWFPQNTEEKALSLHASLLMICWHSFVGITRSYKLQLSIIRLSYSNLLACPASAKFSDPVRALIPAAARITISLHPATRFSFDFWDDPDFPKQRIPTIRDLFPCEMNHWWSFSVAGSGCRDFSSCIKTCLPSGPWGWWTLWSSSSVNFDTHWVCQGLFQ